MNQSRQTQFVPPQSSLSLFVANESQAAAPTCVLARRMVYIVFLPVQIAIELVKTVKYVRFIETMS